MRAQGFNPGLDATRVADGVGDRHTDDSADSKPCQGFRIFEVDPPFALSVVDHQTRLSTTDRDRCGRGVDECLGSHLGLAIDEKHDEAVVVMQLDDRLPIAETRWGQSGGHKLLKSHGHAASMAETRLCQDGPVTQPAIQPYDAIGDVHGCVDELRELLAKLGYENGAHPDGRQVIFLGDLVDRGPDSPGVLKIAMRMVHLGSALVVRGNHEAKLIRALTKPGVKLSHGLEKTMQQLEAESFTFRQRVREFCERMPHHLILDNGNLVVAHAGLAEHLHSVDSGKARAFALYGDTTGEVDDYGLPVRLPWQNDYRGAATVLYGHTPLRETGWVNNTLCLDTGCVFGGALSALRYPERELVQVLARREWYPPSRPLS